jgi:hypothetical protein
MADTNGCDNRTISMRDVLTFDIMQTSEGQGAFQKCAARVQRLDRLNAGV